MKSYLNLNAGSRGRMAALKRAADKLNAGHNLRKSQGNTIPYTWRDVRYATFVTYSAACVALTKGQVNDVHAWYCHTGEQFPRERYVDECESVNISHRGWFSDTGEHSTIRGLVVALPHGRFLAGYAHSDNGERVYLAELYDTEAEAARAGNHYAEKTAEAAREYDERYQEARELEDQAEDLAARLRECLALRNNRCFAALRNEARAIIARVRDIRRTLKTEYAQYI